MVRVVDQAPLGQQRGDLLRRQPIAGLDRRLAGDRVQQLVEQVALVERFRARHKLIDQLLQHVAGIHVRQHGRIAGHQHRVAAERLHLEPQLGQQLAMLHDQRRLGRRQIDRFGDQEGLTLDPAGLDPCSQLLVQDPLVQSVLVDHRHAVVTLGHQVAVVDLQRGHWSRR